MSSLLGNLLQLDTVGVGDGEGEGVGEGVKVGLGVGEGGMGVKVGVGVMGVRVAVGTGVGVGWTINPQPASSNVMRRRGITRVLNTVSYSRDGAVPAAGTRQAG